MPLLSYLCILFSCSLFPDSKGSPILLKDTLDVKNLMYSPGGYTIICTEINVVYYTIHQTINVLSMVITKQSPHCCFKTVLQRFSLHNVDERSLCSKRLYTGEMSYMHLLCNKSVFYRLWWDM